MTIGSALNNALSGLRVNSKLAEVTSNNLANALTPGYGRQTVTPTSSVTGGQGTGVAPSSVERTLDPDLTAARRIADGDLAERTERLDGVARLERALGTTEDANSLANRMQSFETALRTLAETPESPPRQDAAASAARDLADKFTMISTESSRVRIAADDEITRRVDTVNTALERIARINRQIQVFGSTGRETAPLIDERERLIDTVAQNVPIRASQRANGQMELRTTEGLLLADNAAQKLQVTASGELEVTSLPQGRTRDITPGGDAQQRLRGGALAGLFTLRDQIVPDFERRIDALAADLTARTPDPDPAVGATAPGLFVDGPAATAAFERLAPPLTASAVSASGAVTLGAHDLSEGDLVQIDSAPDRVFRVIQPVDAASVQVAGILGGPVTLSAGPTQVRRVDPEGLAGRITLNPAVDAASGGDPARLRDGLNATAPASLGANPAFVRGLLDGLTGAAPGMGPGGSRPLSIAQHVARTAELTATRRVTAEAEVSALGTARETLAGEESGILGVDTDAEMQRLVQIEQAYAANAQVIQTAARMLDELTRIR